MSRSIKRKITVLGIEYIWILNGNSINGCEDQHIRVHTGKSTRSILYIDPYPWEMEIRPKIIEQAIVFAVSKGWNSYQSNKPVYVSKNKDGFYILADGIKFSYQES